MARVFGFCGSGFSRASPRARRTLAQVVSVAVLVASAALPAQESSRVPVNCDRACLEALVDRYLAAVIAHEPSTLPLSADVKYTENEQSLEVGDGFWQTATGRGNYAHYLNSAWGGLSGR